jgi:hypothetical protein
VDSHWIHTPFLSIAVTVPVVRIGVSSTQGFELSGVAVRVTLNVPIGWDFRKRANSKGSSLFGVAAAAGHLAPCESAGREFSDMMFDNVFGVAARFPLYHLCNFNCKTTAG